MKLFALLALALAVSGCASTPEPQHTLGIPPPSELCPEFCDAPPATPEPMTACERMKSAKQPTVEQQMDCIEELVDGMFGPDGEPRP